MHRLRRIHTHTAGTAEIPRSISGIPHALPWWNTRRHTLHAYEIGTKRKPTHIHPRIRVLTNTASTDCVMHGRNSRDTERLLRYTSRIHGNLTNPLFQTQTKVTMGNTGHIMHGGTPHAPVNTALCQQKTHNALYGREPRELNAAANYIPAGHAPRSKTSANRPCERTPHP